MLLRAQLALLLALATLLSSPLLGSCALRCGSAQPVTVTAQASPAAAHRCCPPAGRASSTAPSAAPSAAPCSDLATQTLCRHAAHAAAAPDAARTTAPQVLADTPTRLGFLLLLPASPNSRQLRPADHPGGPPLASRTTILRV